MSADISGVTEMDAYVVIEWETAGATGNVIMLADAFDEELSREGCDLRLVGISTLFAPKGTLFEEVIERFDEHYYDDETFDARANKAFDTGDEAMSKPIERMWKAKEETERWATLFEAAKLVSYGNPKPRDLEALGRAVRDLEQEDDTEEDR